ncbi:MAG: endopeptidase La [Tissierellia bacterium]|nr:endopeptidase La [Tissierellia bacterium]
MEYKFYEVSKTQLPMVTLRGIWIFPHMVMHFDVGRDISKESVEKAILADSKIFLASQKDPLIESPTPEDINEMGVVATIKQTIKLPNGNIRVLVEGDCRARILKYTNTQGYFEVSIEELWPDSDMEEALANNTELNAIKRLCLDDMNKYIDNRQDMPKEITFNLMEVEDPGRFADLLTSYLSLSLKDYQRVLDELDYYKRLILIHEILSQELEIMAYENEINQKVKSNINQNQREFYLKEQLQVIRSELGEKGADVEEDGQEYIDKIQALDIDEKSKEVLLKEANRLKFLAMGSPEINVVRTYLDYVLDLPWGKYTEDRIDVGHSRNILDRDHYGLKDVKERVLEFISVRKLKKDMKGSILCLVGPPGVGKTSIVKSIAESMNRKYISMRLGGMGDEAEIRGHRKTYIGAMPGRIVTSLISAETMNPVLLLDEIDKVSSDYRADPASALLEVLDPSQNNQFVDRYIEIPIDLSQVMFVTTANSLSTIPRALLDRMEVIDISGYTGVEKFNIAKNHLLKKQLLEHGLKSSQLKISDSVIKKIINNYTREAGVRNLERQIAKICRKAAMILVEGKKKSVSVTINNYRDFLGNEKIQDDDLVRSPEVGVVTGLAWTAVGGEILQIEVNAMKGKGKVQLTGSLGDVMKESAMAAISFIRANADKYDLNADFQDKTDLHVHVPEGATPKDGPSAGITITSGILSALTARKVRQDIAMTGEVTIRGRVLPIGGLKEKALAANRYGIKNVIIPKGNEKDLEEIPESVRKDMTFYPVSNVSQVFDLVLEK